MCPLKVDLLPVTFGLETAEIRLLIVTHTSATITLQLATIIVATCLVILTTTSTLFI